MTATPLLLACRPENSADFPEDMREALALLPPLPPGGRGARCEICRMRVLIGPRQVAEYDKNPAGFLIVDFLCAVRQGSGNVYHLGGS